jgi:glucose dehydrogenase
MSLGRNSMQHHHSPLKQINVENANELGLRWQYETNSKQEKLLDLSIISQKDKKVTTF